MKPSLMRTAGPFQGPPEIADSSVGESPERISSKQKKEGIQDDHGA